MQLPINGWKNTLRKLGRKAVKQSRRSRYLNMEFLEQKNMFSGTITAWVDPTGNTPDTCPCNQGDVPITEGDSTRPSAGKLVGNSSSNPHGVLYFEVNGGEFHYLWGSSPYHSGDDVEDIHVTLTVGGGSHTLSGDYYYAPGSEETIPGNNAIFTYQVDSTAWPSGTYNWTFTITYDLENTTTESYSTYELVATSDTSKTGADFPGSANLFYGEALPVVNRATSEFGNGYYLPGLDHLYVQNGASGQPDGIALVTGDDNLVFYRPDGSGGYDRDDNPYSFASLSYDSGTDHYTLLDPDGTTHDFDSSGKLLSVTDRNQNVLDTYSYNTDDTLQSIEDNVGRITHFDYSSGIVSGITDYYEDTSHRQTTSYTHDSYGRLTSMTAPSPDGTTAGAVTTFGYSGTTDLLRSLVDPRGNQTTVIYDAARRVSSIDRPDGSTLEVHSLASQSIQDLSSNSITNLAALVPYLDSSQFAQSGAIGVHEYHIDNGTDQMDMDRNKFGEITDLKDADGNFTYYVFDENGKPSIVYLPTADGFNSSDFETAYHYDDSGALTNVSNPDGSYQSYTFSSAYHQLSSADDGTHSFSYTLGDPDNSDPLGSWGNPLVMRQMVDGSTSPIFTYYTYTSGNTSDTTDYATDNTSTLLPAGLLKTVTDPDGHVTKYTYTSHGLVSSITTAAGTPDASTTHYYYDARDNLYQVVDGNNDYTTYTYNNLDQLIEQEEPNPADGSDTGGPITKYYYDSHGNQTYIIDPNGNATQNVYDSRNRLVQVIQPLPTGTPATFTKDASQATYPAGTWNNATASDSVSTNVKQTASSDATARFSFTGLNASKQYVVLVRWNPTTSPSDTYAPSAQWKVIGNSSAAALATLGGNLSVPAQGVPDTDTPTSHLWQSLGAYQAYGTTSSNGTLTIELSNPNGGDLTVDAVRLVEAGPVTSYGYDEENNKISSTDPLGNQTTYGYDSLNRLTSVLQPAPSTGQSQPTTTYVPNADGWITSTTDPNGNVTLYRHDKLGRTIASAQPSDSDHPGITAEFMDASGNYLSGRLDTSLNFPSSSGLGTSGLPSDFQVHWSGAINIDSVSDTDVTFSLAVAGSASISIDNQRLDYETVVSDSDDSTSNTPQTGTIHLTPGWHWIDVDYQASSGVTPGIILKYELAGQSTFSDISTDMLRPVNQTAYDSVGRTQYTTDMLGRRTTYTEDGLDRTTSITSPPAPNGGTTPTSSVVQYAYDNMGNMIAQIDPLSNTTYSVYDAQNRLKETIQPVADPNASVHSETKTSPTSSTSSTETYAFSGLDNSKNYALLVRWPDDTPFGSRFDSAATMAVFAGPSSTALYSSTVNLNHFTHGVDDDASDGGWVPLGAFTPNSNTLSVKFTASSGASLNTPQVQIVEVGAVTSYTYDGNGNQTSETDPDGNATSWTYDALNRQTAEIVNGDTTHERQYQYDANGNLTQYTDHDGRITKYDYDHLNRETAERWRNSGNTADVHTIPYTYDDDSRLLTANEGVFGETNVYGDSFTYDNLGRATSISSSVPGTLALLSQTFDSDSNRTGLSTTYSYFNGSAYTSYSSVFTASYTYDNTNNMSSIAYNNGTNRLVNFTYNAAGQFNTISRYNGSSATTSALVATSTYGYDGMGRIESMTYTNSNGSGTTFAGYGFSYDAASRLTDFTNTQSSSQERKYAYDNLGQLTNVGYAGNAATHNDEVYAYDANGNRTSSTVSLTSTTYTLNSAGNGDNQIASDGTYDYVYDNEGNLTYKYLHDTTTVVAHYIYDYRNRLTEVTGPSSDVKYLYDAFDRLVQWQNVTLGVNQNYVYDGNNIVMSFTSGDVTPSYDYQLSGTYLWGPAVDMLMHESDSEIGLDAWTVTDQQNTTRVLLSGSGGSVSTASGGTITAFGRLHGMSDVLPVIGGYTGKFYDPYTDLQLNGARWYDEALGRWMSQDPTGLGPGPNPYDYCDNSPTNFTDPTGEAQFGKRPIEDPQVPYLRNWLYDYLNIEICHEQLFFDDGKSPSNLGFFNDGVGPDDPSKYGPRAGYEMDPTHYDDDLMRQAVKNVPPGTYNKYFNNCQHWATAVRNEYNRLDRLKNSPPMPSWPWHGGYGRGGW